MRILFIQDNGINESLALTELSSYLQSLGFETDLLLERHSRDLVTEAARLRPGIILIPVSLLMHRWALGVAARLKARIPDAVIVFGGSHPTFFPEIIEEENVDYLFRGEAEAPFGALAEAIRDGRKPPAIAGLVSKGDDGVISTPMCFDPVGPDDRPPPDRAMYFDRYPFMARFPWKKFVAARGCLFECSYCVNEPLKREIGVRKQYWRVKSPARIVAEIVDVKKRWGLKVAHFSDDVFTADPDWLDEFAELYARDVGVPFSCNAAGAQLDERRVKALRRAGCYLVSIGVETSDESKRVEHLNKNVSNETLIEVCATLRREGLKVITFNIAALPGETIDEAFDTIRFNHQLGSDYMRLNLAIPLPGTGLAERGFELGALPPGLRTDPQEWADRLSRSYKEQEPFFKTEYREQIINLFMLYEWAARSPALTPLVRKMVEAPPNPFYHFLHFLSMVVFGYGFKIPFLAGLRYFLHVGHPENHTTVYPHLI